MGLPLLYCSNGKHNQRVTRLMSKNISRTQNNYGIGLRTNFCNILNIFFRYLTIYVDQSYWEAQYLRLYNRLEILTKCHKKLTNKLIQKVLNHIIISNLKASWEIGKLLLNPHEFLLRLFLAGCKNSLAHLPAMADTEIDPKTCSIWFCTRPVLEQISWH